MVAVPLATTIIGGIETELGTHPEQAGVPRILPQSPDPCGLGDSLCADAAPSLPVIFSLEQVGAQIIEHVPIETGKGGARRGSRRLDMGDR